MFCWSRWKVKITCFYQSPSKVCPRLLFSKKEIYKIRYTGTLEILTFKETLTEQSGQSSFPLQNNLPLNKQ